MHLISEVGWKTAKTNTLYIVAKTELDHQNLHQ